MWIRERRYTRLVVEPNAEVQVGVTKIADYVTEYFSANSAASFLKGADPWVIAHALATDGVVVTQETRVPANSTKAKIPNICEEFRVPWVNMYQMLRELGVSLG